MTPPSPRDVVATKSALMKIHEAPIEILFLVLLRRRASPQHPQSNFPPPLISIPFSQIRASTYSKPKVFRVSKESVWVSPNMAIENRVT